MLKPEIKIRLQNGLSFDSFKREVFDVNGVSELFEFIESDHPDFIIFGPYGNDIPAKGNYSRIGYFCENIIPDLSICEWAFGVPYEDEINHKNYKRIQWHGQNPNDLIKNLDDNYIDRIINSHTGFCNFFFSNPVPYREEFFRQLSKYKKVDSPGKSVNNMASIDQLYNGDIFQRKKQFLSRYKFTIAFENYCYPGYQTEKLYDAMQVGSIPIYCGDPLVGRIFNTDSFLNVGDYMKINTSGLVRSFEKLSEPNFKDIRPQFFKSPTDRVQRKLKSWGREIKMKMQFNKLDFSELIDRVIELDKDQDLYKKHLSTPWFRGNLPPAQYSSKAQWQKIFSNE